MAVNVGQIAITLTGNTASFRVAMNDAEARAAQAAGGIKLSLGSLRNAFGAATAGAKSLGAAHTATGAAAAHGVTGTQAASGAIRVLEGNLTNSIRAAENFVGRIPGVSNVLKTIFPVVGGLALVGVFIELGKRAVELYEKIRAVGDAPRKITEAFAEVTGSIRLSNAELAVVNDKLLDAKNKFEGKPKNAIKDAIDEATAAAERLSGQLTKDIALIEKTIADNKVGVLDQILGHSGTADLALTSDDKKNISAVQQRGTAELYAATTATDKYAAANRETIGVINILGAKLGELNAKLAKSKEVQANLKTGQWTNVNNGNDTNLIGGLANGDERIAAEQGQIAALQATITGMRERLQNVQLNADPETHDKEPKAAPQKDVFAQRLAEFRISLAGARAELKALGTDDTYAVAVAKGFERAQRAIEGVNEELKEQKKAPLTQGQGFQLVISAETEALIDRASKATEKFRSDMVAADNEFRRMNESADKANEEKEKALIEIADRTREYSNELKNVSLGPNAKSLAGISAITDPDPVKGDAKKIEALEKYKLEIAQTVDQINRQTQATRNLIAVEGLGIDAKRTATAKTIASSGKSPDVIAAEQASNNAQNDLADKTQLRGQYGSASNGAKQVFQDMANNAQTAAQIVHTSLGGAFDSLNDAMSRLISGQKVSWDSFFRGLAAQLAKVALTQGFAEIGSLVTGASGGGGIGGFIGKLFGGGKAAGGEVTGGTTYMVGENGPEMFTAPGGGGSITPNNKLGGASYYIDARGSDSAAVEQRVNRSLAAVHGSAVRSSVQVAQELDRRRVK